MKNLKKLKNKLYITYKIFFDKNSNFRNLLIKNPNEFFQTEEQLNKLIKFHFSEHNPFNGQKVRTEIVQDIISNEKFDKIIETGTHLGNTTKFLSNFAIPIETIEVNKYYFELSKLRFNEVTNVKVINADSAEYLKNLDKNLRYFIYLDAHWYSELPLASELEILSNIKNQIILIDDFKYNEIELSLKDIKIPEQFKIFFPKYNPIKEENTGRGYIFLTSSETYYQKLSEIELLSEYNY